jgi:hypothetical protein
MIINVLLRISLLTNYFCWGSSLKRLGQIILNTDEHKKNDHSNLLDRLSLQIINHFYIFDYKLMKANKSIRLQLF